MGKILDPKNLFFKIINLKKKNPKLKVGLCHGVFDIIHEGHIKHFEYSKNKCDILVVSLTSDQFVNKGPGRPYNDEIKRSNILASIKYIDYVFINYNATPLNFIKHLKPNFYFKGKDYLKTDLTGNLAKESKEIKKFKGRLIITPTEIMSSTKIYNNLFSKFDNYQKITIQNIKSNFHYDLIEKIINIASKTELTLIGDTIIDEYKFCDVIGLASKDPCFSTVENRIKKIQGGALAVAIMASQFVKKVNFFTYGEDDILKKYLKKYRNINLINLNTKLSIQKKTRYLNSNRFEKILQVTNYKKLKLTEHSARLMKSKMQKFKLKNNIIVCDFGVGLFEHDFLDWINTIKDKYLNVQTNSLNYGYNTVKKYFKARYVSLDEREWRLALQDQEDSLLLKLKKLKNYHYKNLTRGKNGSIFIDRSNKIIKSPVFFNKTIDTTGCGDAYFILSSILLINKCPIELIPFLSNIYAGIHSQSLGNEKVIPKNEYLRVVKGILNI